MPLKPLVPPSTPPASSAGRWYLTLVGLSLAMIGAVFVWLMWRSFERARQMRDWPELPCVILSSEVEERRVDPNSPPEFRANISFGYEWSGTRRTGDHLTWRGSPWSSNRDIAEQRAAEYPTGKATTCRVNPADPAFSVLKPDSKAPLYSIMFPALFVVGGLGISVKAWISDPKRDKNP